MWKLSGDKADVTHYEHLGKDHWEETTIGDEQFGFMQGRGTTDAIFAVRQLREKHREKQKELHMVFIDLEKAYDRVPRQEVWRCMREKGVPEKYVMIVQDMYEGARTRVKSSVGLTDMIPVGVGLHQGSSLSPYRFAMIMDVLARGIKAISPWCMYCVAPEVRLLKRN